MKKTYRLIIDGGKEVDDEFYTSKTTLLKVISSIVADHKVEVMVYEGEQGDEQANYRMTLDRNLVDKGY